MQHLGITAQQTCSHLNKQDVFYRKFWYYVAPFDISNAKPRSTGHVIFEQIGTLVGATFYLHTHVTINTAAIQQQYDKYQEFLRTEVQRLFLCRTFYWDLIFRTSPVVSLVICQISVNTTTRSLIVQLKCSSYHPGALVVSIGPFPLFILQISPQESMFPRFIAVQE